MVVALLYRWKGFDQAVAFGYRAKKCKNKIVHGLSGMFGKAAVRRAEQDLVRLEREDDADSMAAQVAKKTIRGGKILTWLESDQDGASLETAIALNKPLQHYLNHCFKAEAAVEKVILLGSNGIVGNDNSNRLQLAEDEAVKHNLEIIDGSRGALALSELSALLKDFNDPAWSRMNALDTKQKAMAGCGILVGLGEAYWRLVFKTERSNLQVFKAVESPTYNEAAVNRVVVPLKSKQEQCQRCVAKFASAWVSRLTHDRLAIRRKAYRVLRCKLSTIPLISAKTERKHLQGQETGGRKRGKRFTCTKFAKVTYRKGVIKKAKLKEKMVLEKHLPTPAALRQWTAALSAFEINRHRKAGRKYHGNVVQLKAWGANLPNQDGSQRAEVIRALDVFVSDRYHTTSTVESAAQRRAKLNTMWHNLSDEERAVYVAQAKAETETLKKIACMTFGELVATNADATLRKSIRQRVRHQAAARTLENIRNDPAWSSGGGVSGYGSGLRPDLVQSIPYSKAKVESDDVFKFDATVQQNNWLRMKPDDECHIQHKGLCCEDALLSMATLGTASMYRAITSAKLKKYPLLIELSVPGPIVRTFAFFITRFFGKGDTAIMVTAAKSDNLESSFYVLKYVRDTAVVSTSQLVLRRLVMDAATDQGCSALDFEKLDLVVYNSSVCEDWPEFAVEASEVTISSALSLVNQPKKSTKAPASALPFGLQFLERANV